MAIIESLLIALGTGVAKYLAKEALPKDWQDQIAAELVSWGVRQYLRVQRTTLWQRPSGNG